MNKINVAILGAGNIARSMATALNGIKDEVNLYAVASRSLEKAEALRIMGWMDYIRNEMGVVYPFEQKEDIQYSFEDIWR